MSRDQIPPHVWRGIFAGFAAIVLGYLPWFPLVAWIWVVILGLVVGALVGQFAMPVLYAALLREARVIEWWIAPATGAALMAVLSILFHTAALVPDGGRVLLPAPADDGGPSGWAVIRVFVGAPLAAALRGAVGGAVAWFVAFGPVRRAVLR